MELKTFKCPQHPIEDIAFFCTVNQWHFVPLCDSCIPPHTQNHPKNFKVSIESYQRVRQKSAIQNKFAIQQYQKRLEKITNFLSAQKCPQMYQTIQSSRTQLIDFVNNYFDKIKKSLDERLAQTIQFQKQLLVRLEANVKADIHDLENYDKIQQVQQWGDVVRRLYFKDGITPYLQQIDEVLKDHQQRVFKRKDLAEVQMKKLQQDLRKILSSYIFLNKQNVAKIQQTNKIKPKEQKDQKKPKIIIKAKICKNCNGQLQYLTQLKKHLYCPNCGGKERNYTVKRP